MAYLALILFLLAIGLAWAGVLIFFMARHLLSPRRMTDERAFVRVNRTSPNDLGLSFMPMGFTVQDAASRGKIRLAGWWIPAAGPSTRTVLVVHGYGDAKVGGIAWAPTWHALGWNVLAVDLRAHGQSDGAHSTAGYYEQDDLDQIIVGLRNEKPVATQTLALFGISLGAACVAAVAAGREDIAAVILESPYADYRQAVRRHMERAGFPLVTATELICRTAEWLSRSDFKPVRPSVTIPRISAPLLAITGDADPLIDIPAIADAIAKRPSGRITQHAILPGVGHITGLAADPDGYTQRLADFMSQALHADSGPRSPLLTGEGTGVASSKS